MKHYMKSILIITFLILSITHPTIVGETNNIKPLYEARKKTIPDTLPWYPIIVFGDNRPSTTSSTKFPKVFYNLVAEMDTINPIAVIGTGDHVGMGYEDQYRELYRVFNETGLENIWLAIGNHDVDVDVVEGRSNWKKYVGPETYVIDDIPGWRIGVVDSETRLSPDWRTMLVNVYKDIGNRSLILVYHRPAYPGLDHNLDSERISMLNNVIQQYGKPRIVIQGHWHGWAYAVKDNITWIVTGGAGAPLYSSGPDTLENGEIVKYVYHYMVLILYPNNTYTFYPVKIDGGSIKIVKVNETSYLIENSKVDLHNNPVEIPIRIKYSIGEKTIYTVLMANPGSKTILTFHIQDNVLRVYSNSSNWYLYIYNVTNPDQSETHLPLNNVVEVSLTTETPITESIGTSYSPLPILSETSISPSISNISTTSGAYVSSLAPIDQTTYLYTVAFILLILIAGTVLWYFSRK